MKVMKRPKNGPCYWVNVEMLSEVARQLWPMNSGHRTDDHPTDNELQANNNGILWLGKNDFVVYENPGHREQHGNGST